MSDALFPPRAPDARTPRGPAGKVNSRHRARQRDAQKRFDAVQKENADLHAALFEATQVHRRLCAPRRARFGPFDVASEIFAVRYLPGDFFVIEDTRDGAAILALGDVCGKGLAAGMWTPCLIGLVRAHAVATSDPQAILTEVNREFCRMLGPLTSLFLLRLDSRTGTVDYCNAGHPPALLSRTNGDTVWLSEGGMLLGMTPEASFPAGRAHLRPGDLLLAYSDGILDARNDSDEDFGAERLAAELRLARADSADALLYTVLAAVQDFAGLNELADDTSIVIVRHHDVRDPGGACSSPPWATSARAQSRRRR